MSCERLAKNRAPALRWTLLYVLAFSTTAFPQGALPPGDANFPVMITIAGTEGSGFLVSDSASANCFLISARHVFFKDTAARHLLGPTAKLDGCEGDLKYELLVNLDSLFGYGLVKADTLHDIAVAWLCKTTADSSRLKLVLNRRYASNVGGTAKPVIAPWSSMIRYERASIGNDVFIFGYPRSLGLRELPQIDFDLPLVHKGIVAGKNTAKKTLVIDAAVYPGNSGGPVVQVERGGSDFYIAGIVTEYVPFADMWLDVTRGYANTTISTSSYSIVEPLDPAIDSILNWRWNTNPNSARGK